MDDVERVVRRDYAPDMVADILRQIDATEVREKARVVLTCLKLAKGDVTHLQAYLRDASGWYREFLSEAEYPLASKRWSRMEKMTDEEQASIYERDWKQYIAWLGRDAEKDES
jgi:hypothetical protein